MPLDDYAIVLDYLPEGRMDLNIPPSRREKRVTQVIGEDFYSLLEIVLREEEKAKIGERLYIGKGVRDKVLRILRKMSYDDLTAAAKDELSVVLENLVKNQEKKFVYFFNECGPLTTRLHRLELVPGVGKKHMWEILNARKEKKFENLKEINERIKLLQDVQKAILKRLLWELKGYDDSNVAIKHKIFIGAQFAPKLEEAKEEKEK